MPSAHWTPEAEADLEEIVSYIAVAEHRPLVAERIAHEFSDICLRYAASPLSGQSEPRLGPDYRRFALKRWIVLYRPWKDGIVVLRIVDGARDFNRLFGLGG